MITGWNMVLELLGNWMRHVVTGVAGARGLRDTAGSTHSEARILSRRSVVIDGNDQQAQLVQRFLDLGRAAILLRPTIAETIAPEHLAAVRSTLKQDMAWTPEGEVLLTDWSWEREERRAEPSHLEHVSAFLLDRYPVTNGQFREFVSHGGYTQEAVWDANIWPRVCEFVDRTGQPGPRFWSEGQFVGGTADCPVVGVSWYEADAFARWVGKRLPTDAEWVRVAACPASGHGAMLQRRFPWGDVLDPSRTNLWISGLERTAAIDEFSAGSSANGVSQLVGNVWEWTTTDMRMTVHSKEVHFESPLKSLRGGAFDSYFEQQATCQLQSGDVPVARRHNIGFRCALSMGDAAGLETAS